MRMFHTTDCAAAILAGGFRDGTGAYMFASVALQGVFLSSTPADVNDGASGDEVLEVMLPDGLDLSDWALVEVAGEPWEWCVPAAVVNEWGSVRLMTDEEVWTAKGW